MAATKGKLNGGGAQNGSFISSLTPDQLYEVQQYEKLLMFCNDVAGGSHPRIKPSHLHGKPAQGVGVGAGPPTSSNAPTNLGTTTKPPTGPKALMTGARSVIDNTQSFQANAQRPPVNNYPALPGLKTLSGSSSDQARSFGSGKVEINPVLLEKSDDLIKAELQLHRQRLERSLKEEQAEQKRASLKASSQASEQLPDLDIADILTRALAVVQGTGTGAQPTDDTAANASASSDSFDDNTFYSSQHDTPQSNQVSRLPNDSEDEQMRDASPYEPEFEPEPATVSSQERDALLPAAPLQPHHHVAPSTSTPSSARPQSVHPAPPGLSSEATSVSRAFRQLITQDAVSSQGSGPTSRSEESLHAGQGRAADSRDLARVNEQLLNRTLRHEESPVVRAHDLSPLAPQPAHVSPLAVARQQQLALSDSSGRIATPAQVAALRKQPSAATSPESSPQGGRGIERKKSKKKKRKADRIAPEAAPVVSPYIKPEPRSPSPVSAQPFLRPTKRQRQSQPQQPTNSESRYEQAVIVEDGYRERYQTRPYREERGLEYGRGNEQPRREDEREPVPYPRYERVYYDDSRQAPVPRQGVATSPGVHAVTYLPREVRPGRSVSHVVDGSFGDTASYIREAPAASRMSVRPTAYQERQGSPTTYERAVGPMGPPKAAPTRIIVDEFGREYIEPPRPPVVARDGVISEQRPVDPELVYGRPPPSRAISRRVDMYEDDAGAYRPAETPYPAPRRVVTQPELAGPEHRAYRERGYSGHAMPPPTGEFLPPRPLADSRTVVESPREYIPRSGSVRPPMEPSRYETTPVTYGRPREERPHEYYGVRATSVRPPEGTRYEIPVGYERRVAGDDTFREYTAIRSASVRPAEAIRYEVAREYRVGSVRPDLAAMGGAGDYAGAGPVHSEVMPAPGPVSRAYSVHPGEAPPSHLMRPGSGIPQGGERYYGRPPAPQVQDDEEVVFLDRPPREMYRQGR